MKIVLLMPRGALYRYKSGIFQRPIRYAPLTLTTLAALIPPEIKAEVEIIDEGIQQMPRFLDADLVGISAITGTAMRAYAIADRLRKENIPVVLGGVHPTLMPDEAARHADSVVSGFAEDSWPQLLRDFTRGKLKRFYFQSPELSLENTPMPKRQLLRPKGYFTIHTIQATRGCVNLCDFCVVPVAWGRRMYFRPIPAVIDELEAIESKNILFVDVSPIEDKEYAKKLYKAMIPLKKNWVSPATIKIADDPQLLKLAADSGCKGLLIGFESVSQATLKLMGKGFNYTQSYAEQVKKLHGQGIAIQACFVFGFDSDSPDVFARTVEAVNTLHLDLPRFTAYTPFPGTPIFKKLKAEGRIIEENWSLYDAQHVVFRPALMSQDELQQGLFWAWKEAYKFNSIFSRLLNSRCILGHMLPANLAYRFYANNLSSYNKEMMVENCFN